MLWMILFALLGVLSVVPMVQCMNHMPARCFCDYDEIPDERHAAPRVTRKQTILCAVLLAIIFALLIYRFGLSLQACALCLFSLFLVMISLADLRFCIIPDELLIAGCFPALLSAIPDILSGETLIERLSPLTGALIGASIILIINLMGRLFYKKDSLGMGDLKLMALCGLACGNTGIIIAALSGILAAGLWFAVAILLKRIRSDEYLPLGPFLVFGTVFTCCFRPAVDALLAWYISLL